MKHRKLETTPEISKRMSKLSKKRSKVEMRLASALWHKGYRYRINYKELPGSPDIVLLKYNIAIFIDGEFWHGKDFDENKKYLKNNQGYWIEHIKENMERDQKNDKKLSQMGWIVIHFWSRSVDKELEGCIQVIEDFIEYQMEGMR